MFKVKQVQKLLDSGLGINQGCNLKWKLGDEQERRFYSPAISRGRTSNTDR